jgi:hypothetical protein
MVGGIVEDPRSDSTPGRVTVTRTKPICEAGGPLGEVAAESCQVEIKKDFSSFEIPDRPHGFGA